MLISDVLASTKTPLHAGLIKRFVEVSPMMQYLNFETLASINHKMLQEGKLPAANDRDYNGTRSASTVVNDEPIHVQMTDFGSKVSLDPVLADEPSLFEGQFKLKARKAMAKTIGLDLKGKILGNSLDLNSPKRGIYQWSRHWYDASTNVNEFPLATNGAKVSASITNFVTMLNKLILRVRPTFMQASATVISDIISATSTSGTNDIAASLFTWDKVNVNGREENVINFRGIPIIQAGEDSTGADVMRYNETCGNSNVTASIVAVRSGEDDATIVMRYPEMMKTREYVESGMDTIEVHMPMAVEVRNKRSVGRLYGILTE